MTTSINQPWAISDKFKQRYGSIWSEMDFVFEKKISNDVFKTDPMNTLIGTLQIAGQTINMRYKDLISYAKSIETLSTNLYAERVNKKETFQVSIKGRNFDLTCQEIGKLSQTINEASSSALRAYEIGLYL
jgi:hypothetical protein